MGLNIVLELLLIVKYLMVAKVIWNEKFTIKAKRNWIVVIPAAAFLFVSTDEYKDISLLVLQYVLVASVLMLLQENALLHTVRELVVGFFLLVIVEAGTTRVVELFFGMERDWRLIMVAVNLISILMVWSIWFIKKMSKSADVKLSLEGLSLGQMTGIISLLAVISVTFSYVLQYICKISPDKLNALIGIGAVMAAGIAMIILMCISFHIANGKMLYKSQLEMENQLHEKQTEYFKMMLKKEEETKNFRHDINNHLYTLSILMRDDPKEAKEYLEEMIGSFQKIYQINYETGNEILNIIFNHYLDKIEKEAGVCEITVSGKLMANLQADKLELCTIFSNVLQNVQEALVRLESRPDKICRIKIDAGKIYARVIIENTTEDTKLQTETKKKDKNLHGRGIANVRKVIEKIHGEMTMTCEDGIFRTEVVIPLKR